VCVEQKYFKSPNLWNIRIDTTMQTCETKSVMPALGALCLFSPSHVFPRRNILLSFLFWGEGEVDIVLKTKLCWAPTQ